MATMEVDLIDIGTMIRSDPGIRGGRPRIAGTGVTVRRMVSWWKMGYAVDDIADEYPNLAVAQVYAALAYYHANRAQLDRAFAAEEAEEEQMEREFLSKRNGE